MYQLQSVTQTYERRGNVVTALDTCNIEIPDNDFIAIVGPSGSGKTTLMKLICGLLLADEGDVDNGFRTQQMINLGAGFDPHNNALQNLETELFLRNIPTNKQQELMQQIIKFAELEEFTVTPVGKFTSGMAARLGFSLCVHTNPELLIIDEVSMMGSSMIKSLDIALRSIRQENSFLGGLKIILLGW